MLNLGVEGMMLAGAIAALATANETGVTTIGVLAELLGVEVQVRVRRAEVVTDGRGIGDGAASKSSLTP